MHLELALPPRHAVHLEQEEAFPVKLKGKAGWEGGFQSKQNGLSSRPSAGSMIRARPERLVYGDGRHILHTTHGLAIDLLRSKGPAVKA